MHEQIELGLVNLKTGEIVRELDKGDKVVSKEQSESYKRHLDKVNDKRHFSFAFMENIKELIPKLSNVHLGYLLKLQCYMEFGTGVLIGEDGKGMTKKIEIQSALNISKDVNKRFSKALEDNGVLEKVNGKYRVNPAYHFRGKIKEEMVIKLFTTTLKQLCEVLKPAEIGFLYKLLPYIHYETNMICFDPNVIEPYDIEFLNVKAIAQLIGMEEKKVSTLLTKLRKASIVAEVRRENKKNIFFVLNPYVFYRKSGFPDDTLRGMFISSPYTLKK